MEDILKNISSLYRELHLDSTPNTENLSVFYNSSLKYIIDLINNEVVYIQNELDSGKHNKAISSGVLPLLIKDLKLYSAYLEEIT